MKKVSLSLALLLSIPAFSADSLMEAFSQGKLDGQIRTFYISRNYEGSINYSRDALSLGGSIGYETASLYGLSLGAKFYTTNGVGGNNGLFENRIDPTLFGDDTKSYSQLGEAYIKAVYGKTAFKAGRQKLDTPLAGADDARMVPNLFEAYVLSNSDIKDTTLIAGHVNKISAGSFSNAYAQDGFSRDANKAITGISANGALALASGYGLNNVSNKFMDMADYAIGGLDNGTNGVSVVAVVNKSLTGTTIQLWDYYAYDILNAIYADVTFTNKVGNFGYNVALQYINESDIGDKLAGEIDSTYYGAKIGGTLSGVSLSFAYSNTGSSDGATLNGGVISPWGGMPAYTQGMVTRHQFFADTDAYKVSLGYNLKSAGLADVDMTLAHCEYESKKSIYNGNKDLESSETLFDIIYKPANIKGLNLRLRGNYPSDFKDNLSWNEYRFIANYNF